MWNLASQSALVAVLIAVATAIALLMRGALYLHRRYAGFAISIALYYLSALTVDLLGRSAWLDACRVMSGGFVVIMASIFLEALMGDAGVLQHNRTQKTVLSGLAIMIIGATPLSSHIAIKLGTAIFAIILLAIRIQRVAQRAQNVKSRTDKARLRYFSVAGLLALCAYGFDIGAAAGFPIPPIGGFGIALFLYFIYQALLVSRLLDLHELIGKAVVLATLACATAGLYWLLASNTVLASCLLLILYEPFKHFLETHTTRLFFKEHLTFARDIRHSTKQLAGIIDLAKACDHVLDTLYDSKRATHASLYLLDAERTSFHLQSYRGLKPPILLDGKIHPVLFRHLMDSTQPLLRSQIFQHLVRRQHQEVSFFLSNTLPEGKEAENTSLLESLDAFNSELLITLHYDSHTVGFLNLKDERLLDAYTNDEIAALGALCDQLAITIENSRVFAKLKERDRLAALGEMSAGLAHEIRNPLAAIKGAAQTLDPSAIPKEDQELVVVIIDEVNRLNRVVSSFLHYAKPYRSTYTPIDLNQSITRMLQLMAHDLPPTIDIETSLHSNLPTISGDSEQLRQVLINLLLNAKEALDSTGTIRITTRLPTDPKLRDRAFPLRAPRFIELLVQDSGKGIPAHLRDKIFIPFFTTKQNGSGLGLALCHRIIQDHGGHIDVRSVPSKGTTFIVQLPILGVHR